MAQDRTLNRKQAARNRVHVTSLPTPLGPHTPRSPPLPATGNVAYLSVCCATVIAISGPPLATSNGVVTQEVEMELEVEVPPTLTLPHLQR